MNPDFADRLKQLDKEAAYYREECGKAQAEVDRLLEILKEVENEKNDKDKKIAELERYITLNMFYSKEAFCICFEEMAKCIIEVT